MYILKKEDNLSSRYLDFVNLADAKALNEFNAIPLSTARKDFLAKNSNGAPVFMLHDSSSVKFKPSINLRHISVQYHVTCNVNTSNFNLENQFCLIECDANSPDLYEIFIRSVGVVIEDLKENCTTEDIELLVFKLKVLFRAFAHPTSREVSGLWGELFTIFNSDNPCKALSLWREDKYDRFDFSSSDLRVEIKSTCREYRIHEFSLEQLTPPSEGNGYVVSLLLQPLTGGVSVIELAERIERLVAKSPQLKQKLWENIAKSLGSDFSNKLDKCFDLSYTEKNFRVYLMDDIPKPELIPDSRISKIRFDSDLSSVVSSLSQSSLLNLSRIFSS